MSPLTNLCILAEQNPHIDLKLLNSCVNCMLYRAKKWHNAYKERYRLTLVTGDTWPVH